MAIIKCKMCGGNLNVTEGSSVAECEYCGTVQTVPSVDDEKKLTLFSRANRLRMACEFDKAASVYENIVAEFPTEAEAYWGLVLCKYGIEYVDDPATGKKVPTCHRSSFDSIFDDSDFDQACENADAVSRRLYRSEAKAIEEIRKGIVEISGKEPPYDIFICYKEADDDGERTVDSVIAQDVYDALTAKGYRVFFSRISLEDKLGTEYEPYIFAALNSAKIMLVFGTDYEYFNAVWVKNEWSRYLKLMAKDKSKHLIPCFKNIDAYDMPKEFHKLQAQDMGKVGAIQDLLRGIDKLLGKNDVGAKAEKSSEPPAEQSSSPSLNSILKRANIFLADKEWEKADEYFNRALDIDPECPEAYIGQFCVLMKLREFDRLANVTKQIPEEFRKTFNKAMKYASPELRTHLGDVLKAREEYIKAREAYILKKKQEKEAKEKEAKEEAKQKALQKLQYLKSIRERIAPASKLLSCRLQLTCCVKTDGTAISLGVIPIDVAKNQFDPCKIDSWVNVVSVAAGFYGIAGLKSDGTVVSVGTNKYGECNVSEWKDVVEITAGGGVTCALLKSGSVVTAGMDYTGRHSAEEWTDIVSLDANNNNIVGLKSNGKVVAVGENSCGQLNVSKWHDVVAISSGGDRTVGLLANGTVVSAGSNSYGECDVHGWKDIVAISAGAFHTVGLQADGTVVAKGDNEYGQCDVSGWTDIVAISAGNFHTVGLRSDGTLVAAGHNVPGQCDVEGIKLFDNYLNIEQERSEKMPKRTKEIIAAQKEKITGQINGLQEERSKLQHEREGLKWFSFTRRDEIDKRLVQIESEISQLNSALNGLVTHE